MYHLDHLLALLTTEKAKEIRFRAGSPPVIVSEEEQRFVQGPPITEEDTMRLLRDMASSRQIRDLKKHGEVQFIYTTRGRSPFVIRAQMKNESLEFAIW